MASNANPSFQSNLEILIRKFIPKELIPPNWKCDKFPVKKEQNIFILNIKPLFTQGQKRLGMFKSVKDLKNHILSYFNFPKSMEYLGMSPIFQFDSIPQNGQTSDGKTGIYKIDLNKICPFLPDKKKDWTANLAYLILNDCWKKLLDGVSPHEMIVCPHSPDFSRKFISTLENPVSYKDYEDFILQWKIRWAENKNKMSEFILETIEKLTFVDCRCTRDNPKALAEAAEYVEFVMDRVAYFAREGAINLPPLNTLDNVPKAIIRKFSVGNYNFVIANEYIKVCESHNINVGKVKKTIRGKPELTTINCTKIEEILKTMTVVTMNMKPLLMFAQTPIPYDGGHCILAADALYELLMDMIVAKRVFYTIGEENWIKINEFFEAMELYFDESEDVYLLDLQHVDGIKTMWEYYCHQLNLHRLNEELETRATRFVIRVLKKKLESLELCFKDIMKYAKLIYLKLATESGSPQSQLHRAVIYCQINCLARKVPKILMFIHNQKSCSRMNIVDCEYCNITEKMTAEMAKMETNEKKEEGEGSVSKKKHKKNKK
ncbi:hypothetical protein GCK72_020773 [Caenorhabditis remanei]|uniref:Uncharacterized protein n=1 Tax=Caenorhabditis remanei TaxID=31234 RepID=A0A6A5GHR1_CAERE|nr:hypothetical protein GCK72_020773 [Caenorhabditis remanei]KAF1754213.1 hypothetical protein GCK72_020773 [Caenorhabditis remanei]